MHTYGSDPSGYDFAAALAAGKSSPTTVKARTLDVLQDGYSRGGLLTAIGLFDGEYCRRCKARFRGISEEARREHRESHEWKDANTSTDHTAVDELAYYERMAPKPDYRPDGDVTRLEPPTRKQLENHRSKFEPRGQGYGQARKAHREACDEIARLYGLTGDSLHAMVLELRREGLSPVSIAERVGTSEASVRKVLRASAA